MLQAESLTPGILNQFLLLAFVDLRDRGRQQGDNTVWEIADVLHNMPVTFNLADPQARSQYLDRVRYWVQRNSHALNQRETMKVAFGRLNELVESQASPSLLRNAVLNLFEIGLNEIREAGTTRRDPVVAGICSALDGVSSALYCDYENDRSEFTAGVKNWLERQSGFPPQMKWIEHQISQAKLRPSL